MQRDRVLTIWYWYGQNQCKHYPQCSWVWHSTSLEKIVWHFVSLQVWHFISLQNYIWHSASLHQFLWKSGVWHKSVWHKNIDRKHNICSHKSLMNLTSKNQEYQQWLGVNFMLLLPLHLQWHLLRILFFSATFYDG